MKCPTALVFVGCALLGGALGCGGIAIIEDDAGGGAGSGGAGSGGAGAVVVSSAQSSTQTGMTDPCALPIGTACDPLAFPECATEQVAGIPCCLIIKSCLLSGVGWGPASCFDSCPQNCELVTDPDHCAALPWCTLGPAGCVSPPPPP